MCLRMEGENPMRLGRASGLQSGTSFPNPCLISIESPVNPPQAKPIAVISILSRRWMVYVPIHL